MFQILGKLLIKGKYQYCYFSNYINFYQIIYLDSNQNVHYYETKRMEISQIGVEI